MRKRLTILSIATLLLSAITCEASDLKFNKTVRAAAAQLKWQTGQIDGKNKLPRSIKNNEIRLVDIYDWTSGFFPGNLWYAYELTNDNYFRQNAEKYTRLLEPLKNFRETHDLGFMIYCSYGNAFRITKDTGYAKVMVQTADNLCSRFNQKTQAIRSWDFGKWEYPVIIDNMMNLELLFWASNYTGNPKYRDIAVRHANTTMKNHFRPDYSSYHVVSYDTITGAVQSKQTFQGAADESAWARGQAWGLYGYTLCYRFTKDAQYRDFAEKIANMIMTRVKTDDSIPYWDYNAPGIPDAPRDASAAAITASALLELSQQVANGQKYSAYAERIIRNLASAKYLAKKGQNGGFILMHSVGSLPHKSEINVPLVYADYYFLEAIKRYNELKK